MLYLNLRNITTAYGLWIGCSKTLRSKYECQKISSIYFKHKMGHKMVF